MTISGGKPHRPPRLDVKDTDRVCKTCLHWEKEEDTFFVEEAFGIGVEVGDCELLDEAVKPIYTPEPYLSVRATFGCRFWEAKEEKP